MYGQPARPPLLSLLSVLPGVPVGVLILREEKEANQGVAYPNDGTMVDGARKLSNTVG